MGLPDYTHISWKKTVITPTWVIQRNGKCMELHRWFNKNNALRCTTFPVISNKGWLQCSLFLNTPLIFTGSPPGDLGGAKNTFCNQIQSGLIFFFFTKNMILSLAGAWHHHLPLLDRDSPVKKLFILSKFWKTWDILNDLHTTKLSIPSGDPFQWSEVTSSFPPSFWLCSFTGSLER